MTKTLSVSAIQNGTVIDHIPAEQGLRIIHLLDLFGKQHQITVGLNLPSQRLQFKDLIKIEHRILTRDEANQVTIFAPFATINIIKNFTVAEKMRTSLPEYVSDVFICSNLNCVTQSEPVSSYFYIAAQGTQIKLSCKYCERTFNRNEVRVKI